MIIDHKWVINYIKKYGRRIIIPKEATIIKKEAFDFLHDEEHIMENGEFIKLIIEFEEGSQLETIERMAFSTEIENTIMLPKSLKRIERNAFYGFKICSQLPKDSEIEICDNDFVFLDQKNLEVPIGLRKLRLSSITEHFETITIPYGAKLSNIEITNGVDKIRLPNGKELVSSDDKIISYLKLKENKAFIIYYEQEGMCYEILDLESQTVLYSRKRI